MVPAHGGLEFSKRQKGSRWWNQKKFFIEPTEKIRFKSVDRTHTREPSDEEYMQSFDFVSNQQFKF